MAKKVLCAAALLLVLTSCKNPRTTKITSTTAAVPTSCVEQAQYDEELGAFVVTDDDNKFSAAVAAQMQQEEELTAAGSERMAGDIQADSAKYGFKPVYFEFNKYQITDLQPDQKPVLQQNAKILQSLSDKGYRFSIEGHACDSAGSTEYNMMLSEDRARSMKEYFANQGVKGSMSFVGFGCEHLIIPSGDRKQQAPNRRVEIYAYKSDETQPESIPAA